ncbi:MAG: DUF362 domain-containing protein [Actinomycetota bacterium]
MSRVYFKKTDNRREFVLKTLQLFEKQLEDRNSFLIKPNIVSYEEYPTTTHPEVLDAVLTFLSGRDMVVADGPAPDAGNSQRVVEQSPLKKVCDSHGVPLINLYTTNTRKFVTPRGYRFKIFALPLERDFVISLPVLKVHSGCQMTGALKNQFGYLTRRERFLMHLDFKDINRGIAEINAVAKPGLFIVDAVQTLIDAQELRHGGRLRDLGYMLVGTDPVSLDSFGLKLLQQVEPKLRDKSPEGIPHIKYASQYNIGELEFEAMEI